MKPTTKQQNQLSRAALHLQASAADAAYAGIVNMILTRQLRVGERTSVAQLAKRLELGHTPVKEAIKRLETEGVLSVAGRSGTTVNSISADTASQVFAMRRNLESFAVDYAVQHVSPADIKYLKGLLAEMAGSLASSNQSVVNAARFIKANVCFHAGIVAAARNPPLDRLYAQIQLQAQIISYLFHTGISSDTVRPRQKEHTEILKALELRDGARLKHLLAEHARTTEQRVLSALSEERAGLLSLVSPGTPPVKTGKDAGRKNLARTPVRDDESNGLF